MKKMVIGFCVTMAFVFGTQAWGAIIYFEPFASSIYVGESLDVNVVMSGLGDDDVGAFDIDVLFDDSVLSFNSYVLTDNLGSIPLFDADDWSWGDLGGGTVNLAEQSWLLDLSFQSDSFILATLSFTGIGAGTSSLLFDNIVISDTWGESICSVPGFGIIKVDPVPEPATFILFGMGIASLARIRSKRKIKN